VISESVNKINGGLWPAAAARATRRGQRATGRGGGLAARRWVVAGWRREGGGLGVAVRRWAVGGWRREGGGLGVAARGRQGEVLGAVVAWCSCLAA
jgi:hypothetical protein